MQIFEISNILPHRTWVKVVLRKIQTYLGLNKNVNTTCQNVQDTTKAVLRGKVIALNVYIEKKKYLK